MSGFEFNEDMAFKLVFQRADDPEPIGVLDFSGPEMTFSGRADESAKAFFDAVIKNQVGRNKHLEDLRREVERELSAAIKQRDEAVQVLKEIAHQDYRGHPSTESRIAMNALAAMRKGEA